MFRWIEAADKTAVHEALQVNPIRLWGYQGDTNWVSNRCIPVSICWIRTQLSRSEERRNRMRFTRDDAIVHHQRVVGKQVDRSVVRSPKYVFSSEWNKKIWFLDPTENNKLSFSNFHKCKFEFWDDERWLEKENLNTLWNSVSYVWNDLFGNIRFNIMSFDLRTVTRSYQIINEIGTSDSYYAVTLARDIWIIGVRRLFISILHLFLLLRQNFHSDKIFYRVCRL